jgi:3-phenylpropionate/cinnamic acid dioxygenase small subunit
MEQALFWSKIYGEILAMEEKVMARVQELMAAESPRVRREVQLTNVPVIASQVERFRQRHEYWTLKVRELRIDEGVGAN